MTGPTLIVGETLRDLIEPLAVRLSEPLDDPLASELVAVSNLGVRQWTTRQLSRRLGAAYGTNGTRQGDGIVANIDFPFPDALMNRLLGAPEHDPWALPNLVWVVLDELQRGAGDRSLGPAGRAAARTGSRSSALPPEPSSGTWYGRARHLADLFDRYSRHRPELIRQWAAGNDVDGRGRPLAKSGASQLWQPELWRRLRSRIGEPGPAERLAEQITDLDALLKSADLPPRITMFGLSALPPVWFALLPTLSRHCDLAVLWLTPSSARWQTYHAQGRGVELGPWLPKRPTGRERDDANALLGRWSRPAQEAALMWGASLDWAPSLATDPVPAGPTATTLARLQASIRRDLPALDVLEGAGLNDRSIVVHRAHGSTRQVEIARTAVAHALTDDPTLSLDDVLILSPDVDTYGPLVAAAFAPGPSDPTSVAPVPADTDRSGATDAGSPADGLTPFPVWSAVRSPGTDHPIARAVLGLLDLVDGRATVGDVLDLLALAPVATRFGLAEDDVDDLGEWARMAGVRWGLDGSHRAAHGLPSSFTAATWTAGLDRLLLGSTTTAEELIGGLGQVIPVDVEGSDVGLVARLSAAVGQLRQLVSRLWNEATTGSVSTPAQAPRRPLSSWVDWVTSGLEVLTVEQAGNDWQRRHLLDVLADLRPLPAGDGDKPADPILGVGEFRAAITESLSAVRRRGGPAEGAVTLGPLPAMRSVPARVICLLGVDADILGSGTADADDLLAASPALGDRDPRADGRQLLLEAILAAGDRLIITTSGRDPATNAEVPLPVVLAELLEELAAPEDNDSMPGGTALVDHPRHDFDSANFRPGALSAEGPWSFNPVGLAEAQARHDPNRAVTPFLDGPLAADDGDESELGGVIELSDLHRFIAGPPTAFLSQRLGVTLPRHEDLGDELHPVEVDALHRYQLHTALLGAAFTVGDLDMAFDQWSDVERCSGDLPPGQLADEALAGVLAFSQLIMEECELADVTGPGTSSVEVEVELPDGTSVRGVVSDVDRSRPGPVRIGAQKLKPKHELAMWLDLLMLAGDDPTQPWRGVHIGRGRDRSKATKTKPKGPTTTRFEPELIGADTGARLATAHRALQTVVALYRRNLVDPLPLWPNSTAKICGRTKLQTGDWAGTIAGGARVGDGNDAATLEIWGDLTEHEYQSLPSRPDDLGDRNESRRPLRLGQALWSAFDASVTGSINSRSTSP